MKSRILSVERLESLAIRAIADGSTLEQWRDGRPRRLINWDVAMQCQSPVPVELHARHSAYLHKRVAPLTIVLQVRCRKCDWCKKMRERLWTGKAISEWGMAARTWFVTLTFTPENHFLADNSASVRLRKAGADFDLLMQREKFEERTKELGKEITLFLKRLRKGTPQRRFPQFRYLIVAEAHKGRDTGTTVAGRPHFHMLIHELVPGSLIDPSETRRSRKDGRYYVWDDAFIRRQWRMGHSKIVLAENRNAAAYVCKYISKAALVRMRASFRYGAGSSQHKRPNGSEITEMENECDLRVGKKLTL